MKKRVILDFGGRQFSIPMKPHQYVTSITDTRFAICENQNINGVESQSIIQVFNADTFRVEDCCGGSGDPNCACNAVDATKQQLNG